jgi:NADH-quinone oxidoreductase subunit N
MSATTSVFTSVTQTTVSAQLMTVLPEILMLVATLIVLLVDIFKPAQEGVNSTAVSTNGAVVNANTAGPKGSFWRTDLWAIAAIVPAFIATLMQMFGPTQYAFSGMYVSDDFAHLLKLCAYVAVAVSFIYAGNYLEQRNMRRGEFYLLGLFALLGIMVMISANNLLVVYVGLELLSLSMYAMAALRRDSVQATEAAMKYFVLGALASGFLLYGMSMVYGGAGTLEIPKIAKALTAANVERTAVFGVVFIVAGLAFKFGAVPFHMWVPDVYEGTPSAVTLLIAGAPKLAAFAIAFRMLVEGLSAIAGDWQQMLMMLSVASIALGNLVAIAQTNFKRMLAYSTISHVGFVFLGLISGVAYGTLGGNPAMVGATSIESAKLMASQAYAASTFYVIIYVLMTLGTFGVLMGLARKGFECDQIDDLKGLVKREPWLALILLLLMFSMAGIPPLVGFYAKFAVLAAVVKAGYLWLAIFAVLFSLIGAFYYLRIVKLMIFDAPVDKEAIVIPSGAKATLAVNGFLIVALGLLPAGLLAVCIRAVQSALGT